MSQTQENIEKALAGARKVHDTGMYLVSTEVAILVTSPFHAPRSETCGPVRKHLTSGSRS